MKNKLFWRQLKLYLKSPLVYIFSIIFEVFVYINFFIKLQFFTGGGTTNLVSFFSAIPYICIIIIPALCYKANFTIYNDFLPYSKFTKLIANFLYTFICYVLMILLLIPAIIVVACCGKVDFGQIFTSFLCLILYGAALISLCLFIEKLCNSQILSLIVSAVVLAVFNSAHLFAVYTNVNTFFANICKQISFAWHFDAAGKGIIDTRDILFLVSSTFLFFLCSFITIEIKAGRKFEKKEKTTITLYYILLILVILNSSRWYKRFDLSKDKTYSISEYSTNLLNKIDKTLKITYYRSSSLNKLYPQIRDVSDYLTAYCSQNKNIALQIKDPDKENLTSLLNSYGIYSQQLRSVTNNSTEFIDVYSAIIVEYNGISKAIPFIMVTDTLEYDLDERVLMLLSNKERVVNIIVGNELSLAQDYNYIIPYLNSQGFVCNPLYIENPEFDEELQSLNGTLMIIGDSQINIDTAISIESYILKNKGNAFIMTSPFVNKITDDWSLHYADKTNIVEMLENWGVTFTNEIAADVSCARITMYSQDDSYTNTQVLNYPLWISLLSQNNCKNGSTMFWPVKLKIENENVNPYFETSKYAYSNEIDRSNKESLIETNPFILEELSGQTKQKEQIVVGAEIKGSLTGLYNDFCTDNSHIIVLSDQYFLNSLMNEYIGGETGDYRNFDSMVNILLKLNDEYELAELQSKTITDKSLYKITDYEQLKSIQNFTYILIFAIIPAIIILFAVLYILAGRKHEQK